MCTYALNIFKVKFVYFGQFNDKFGGCGSVLKRNEFIFKGGIMEKESYQLIKGFYERGNQRISEDMRNRRSKKVKL
jgi:tRNA-specific adenosine deaminase 2